MFSKWSQKNPKWSQKTTKLLVTPFSNHEKNLQIIIVLPSIMVVENGGASELSTTKYVIRGGAI